MRGLARQGCEGVPIMWPCRLGVICAPTGRNWTRRGSLGRDVNGQQSLGGGPGGRRAHPCPEVCVGVMLGRLKPRCGRHLWPCQVRLPAEAGSSMSVRWR